MENEGKVADGNDLNILQENCYVLQKELQPRHYEIIDAAMMQFEQLLNDNQILAIRLESQNELVKQLTDSYGQLDDILQQKQKQITSYSNQIAQKDQAIAKASQELQNLEVRMAQLEKANCILRADLQSERTKAQQLLQAQVINRELDKIKFNEDLREILQQNVGASLLAEEVQTDEVVPEQTTNLSGVVRDFELSGSDKSVECESAVLAPVVTVEAEGTDEQQLEHNIDQKLSGRIKEMQGNQRKEETTSDDGDVYDVVDGCEEEVIRLQASAKQEQHSQADELAGAEQPRSGEDAADTTRPIKSASRDKKKAKPTKKKSQQKPEKFSEDEYLENILDHSSFSGLSMD